MKTIRKAQSSAAGAREALRKRGRLRRNSVSSPTASSSVVDSSSEVSRRRPRLTQPFDEACGVKHEKFSTVSTASSIEGSSTSRSRASLENCMHHKSGSPRLKDIDSQEVAGDAADEVLQPIQSNEFSFRSCEDAGQTSLRQRNARQDLLVVKDRPCHHAGPVEPETSPDNSQALLPTAGHRSSRQRLHVSSANRGRVKTLHLTDRHFVQPAPSGSAGILCTPKNRASIEVNPDDGSPATLNDHTQALAVKSDEKGHISHKPTASASMLQLLLGGQLPSYTVSAVGLLESRLRGKLVPDANSTCGIDKPVRPDDHIVTEETLSEGEEHESANNSVDENNVPTTPEGAESSKITCHPSGSTTLQTHPPPLYYSVLTSNGLHTKQETMGNVSYAEGEIDHENYPVVKGVSRDNTKKRWAVYWKGSRKYFYDKCYADCHQAYLSAVEFRRQAKACNAPGPPPKRHTAQNEFYIPAPASSFRFTPYSSGITTFPTAPSTPPAFSACEIPSPSAALIAKRSPAATSRTTFPEHPILGSTKHSELSASLNEREALNCRSDLDPCASSPTTADSCDVTDTLQVYRCAVIILLQDLLYEVLPPRIAAVGPAWRSSPSDPSLKARAEERFLSASLLLLQRTLQGHIAKAERGGEEDLNQLLSVLMPSLDRQLLPSELPRELQQTMLLQLTTLRL